MSDDLQTLINARGSFCATSPDGTQGKTRRKLGTAICDVVHGHRRDLFEGSGVRIRLEALAALSYFPDAVDAGWKISGIETSEAAMAWLNGAAD